MAQSEYLFFAWDPVTGNVPQFSMPDGLSYVMWTPSWRAMRPAMVKGSRFFVWWIVHHLHIFANRDYAVLTVYDRAELVHRSCIFPRYFRFPFMATGDLQIGDTWTHVDYRGKGIAKAAIALVMQNSQRLGRRIWYLVERENSASISVIKRAGFTLAGVGTRRTCRGLRVLGSYRMESLATRDSQSAGP